MEITDDSTRPETALAQTLRRHRPLIPILFITGHADRDRLAGEQVLDKPFSLGALADGLHSVMAGVKFGRDDVSPESR